MKRLLLIAIIVLAGCQSFPDKWGEVYETRQQGGTCYEIALRMCQIWGEDASVVIAETIDGRLHAFVCYKGELYDTTMNIGDTATVLATSVESK